MKPDGWLAWKIVRSEVRSPLDGVLDRFEGYHYFYPWLPLSNPCPRLFGEPYWPYDSSQW
jgi:hypothetical protein